MAGHATHVEIAVGLAPQGLLVLGVMASGTAGTVRRGSRSSLFTSISGLILLGAGVAAMLELGLLNRSSVTGFSLYDGSLVIDRLSVFITITACLIGGFGVLSVPPVLDRMRPHIGELHAFILSAVLGVVIVGAAREMAALVAGVELCALSAIVLTALAKTDARAVTGALRMVMVNGVASALLLYGLVLLYGLSGRTDLEGVAAGFRQSPAAALAAGLVIVGLAAMLGVVPFSQWLGNSFGAAPGPVAGVTGALASSAAVAALVRVTATGLPDNRTGWTGFTAVFAALSMVYGAVRALRAGDLRHLAVALGIAQGGGVLAALLAQPHLLGESTGPAGVSAVLLQLVGVTATLLLAGVVIGVLEQHGDGTVLRDLSHRGSAIGVAAVVAIASLAGLPPTFGFITRLDAIAAASMSGYAWLAVLGGLTAALGMLAGARAIALVYSSHSVDDHPGVEPMAEVAQATRVAVVALGILVSGALPILLLPLSRIAAGAAGPLTR